MKRLLVGAAALLPLLQAAAAHAETKISTATTAPVATSTAAAGAPDDLTIDSAGSIKPGAAGVAVTLDSNNAVANAGSITFEDKSDSTGVLVLGGHAGGVANTGSITLLESYTATDSDSDGDYDGVFAQSARNFGIRALGPQAFTGDIVNSGTIDVEGNDSGAISIETRLIGNLTHSGTINVIGDRSNGLYGLSVSGDVRVTGAIAVNGEGGAGVLLGDVDGAVVLQSSISASGYRYTSRQTDAIQAKLDADDLKQGGSAVRLFGNVGQGILLDAPPADADTDDTDEDDDGVADASEGTAVLASYGAAPALDIGGAGATSVGLVAGSGYGLVIKGAVSGQGIDDGVTAAGLRIGQPGGGATVIAGGISLAGGSITAGAYLADATAIRLSAGASAPQLATGGTITASVSSSQATAAQAVVIEAGASLPSLLNSGAIGASHAGGAGAARAVVDLSGTLTAIENQGAISAQVTALSGEAIVGEAVALDLSANTSGVIVRQTKAASDSTPSILGAVRLGSGADRLEVLGGTLTGDIAFGAGADALVIDGEAEVTGRLTDSDGALAVQLVDGRLALKNTESIALTSLSVGAGGVLGLTIDPGAGGATRLAVSGAASLADGAKIEIALASLLKTQTSFELIRAGQLTVGATQTSLAGAPFLYEATLQPNAAQGVISVDLRPKTAAEIGLNRSGTAAYAAVFDALDKDEAIEAAFLGKTTQESLVALYDQMLPDHSGASLMAAAAISRAASQAAGTGLKVSNDYAYGAWAQQIYFDIRQDRDQAAGFRARGIGVAAGYEEAWTEGALGLSASFVSTEYNDEGAAVRERVVMNFAEAGPYYRMNLGRLSAELRGGLGFVWFDSDRRLVSADDGLDVLAKADWTGWLADAHFGAAYDLSIGRLHAKPQVALDYLYLREKGYGEAGGGDGFDLSVDGRSGQLLTGSALLTLAWELGQESRWGPELTLGWRTRLAGEAGSTTARFLGGEDFTLDPEDPSDGGAVARLGWKAHGVGFTAGVEGGAEFDSGYAQYDFRAVVKFAF